MPKRITPLTDTSIRTVKPSKKQKKLFDGGGLFLLVTPAGGKLWRLKYGFGGIEKLLTLGAYPQTSLSEVTQKRETARKLLDRGGRPRRRAKGPQDGRNAGDGDLWLGGRPTRSITAPELLKVLRRIEVKGALETAHRAQQNCSQVFRYAIATGRTERNPAGDLRGAIPPAASKHFAAITDPKEIAGLLQSVEAYRGSIFSVVPCTSCRCLCKRSIF